MEVLADKELVGLDAGIESGSIAILLPVVCFHEQLVFRRVKQKLRLQCVHSFIPIFGIRWCAAVTSASKPE